MDKFKEFMEIFFDIIGSHEVEVSFYAGGDEIMIIRLKQYWSPVPGASHIDLAMGRWELEQAYTLGILRQRLEVAVIELNKATEEGVKNFDWDEFNKSERAKNDKRRKEQKEKG